MSAAAPASPPHAQICVAQFSGAVTRGTEPATQSTTPTRPSSATAAPAVAVQPTWELPHSAVDLAPTAYLIGLVELEKKPKGRSARFRKNLLSKANQP